MVCSHDLQIANPSVAALYEDALVYETGSAITSSGALSAYSGAKTGRSPSDKRIVKEEGSENEVWWGPVNKPMTPEVRDTTSSLGLYLASMSKHTSRKTDKTRSGGAAISKLLLANVICKVAQPNRALAAFFPHAYPLPRALCIWHRARSAGPSSLFSLHLFSNRSLA